ncbi:major allergen I polypeptide chain 1-like [Dipodomys merriami]|uniref:major allergen I polypeptide chain 1-like n=1 Tax=Dipodomys merriami TaxID=94247 RepID=UPI0038560B53
MAPTAVLALLGAVLLLTTGGRCDICPAVRDDVNVFIHGSQEEYVSKVATYRSEPVFLQNAARLKACVDAKLTAQDSGLEKIYSSPLC